MTRRIVIVNPAPPELYNGNRKTADRYVHLLIKSNYQVEQVRVWQGEPCDAMIVLHAYYSRASIKAAADAGIPVILMFTGTDLNSELFQRPETIQSTKLAQKLILLNAMAMDQLPHDLRNKATVVLQSAVPVLDAPTRQTNQFVVVGNLREVKDPFRAAKALQLIGKHCTVVQIGAEIDQGYGDLAERFMKEDKRYRWLEQRDNTFTINTIASSEALIISSRSEGGANVISEAVVNNTPVLASRIPGNIGMLGSEYEGFFEFGDEHSLANLMNRFMNENEFKSRLITQCNARKELFLPNEEESRLRHLVENLIGPAT